MNIRLRSHDPISPRVEWPCRSGRPAHVTLSLGLPLLLAVSLLGAGLPQQAATAPQTPATRGFGFPDSPPGAKSSVDDPDYLWGISGVVRDNGGAPVQGAAITTWPEAISAAYSDADGAYAAYVDTYADTYAASVAKAGYGILPTTVFTRVEDARVDFVLPPADNVVTNSGFETGSLEPDWQTSGLAPAVVTTTLRHTGAKAACLGQLAPSFTTPTNISNSPVYGQHWLHSAPDTAGGVHMFWRQGSYGTPTPVYYAWRAGDGTWVVPPEPIPPPGEGNWLAFAVGPDGAAHAVGSEGSGESAHITYATRLPGGTWSAPVALSAEYPVVYLSGPEGWPQIAVGADSTVHVAWIWHLEFFDLKVVYRLLWTSRDASGSWSAPQDISDQDWSYSEPKMALDQAGGVHVIWTNDYGDTKYACRPVAGPWSRPIVILHSSTSDTELAVEADGTAHVVWSDGAFYRIWYTQGSCQGAWTTPEAMTVGALGYPPSLAVDRAGTVHMLWSEWLPLKLQYARRLKGGAWSAPQTLTGVPSYENPTLAMDDSGTVHALWTGGITGWGPGTMQLYHTYRRGDSPWSWPQNISGAAQQVGLWNAAPASAVEGNGRVHAGWSDGASSDLDVYYASSVLAQQTGDSTLSQTITVPVSSTHPMLSFMVQLGGISPGGGSSLGVMVDDETVTTTLSTETDNTNWAHRWLDLQPWAGQTVTVTFALHQVAGEQPPWACLDEVTVGSAYPDAWVSQSGLPTAVSGQQIVDAITYGNRGGVAASNGQVTLELPPELTFVSADPPPSQLPPSLGWDVGDLAANGGLHTISVTLQVAPSVAGGTALTATATISSDSIELEQANNSDEASISIVQRGYLPTIARGWPVPMCLVYSDDFSDPTNGWPVLDTDYYSLGYLNGEYRMVVIDRWANWVYAAGDSGSSDHRVEVDARAASNLGGGVGLVFGGPISDAFYLFEVRDGWFGLRRHDGYGLWGTLIDWRPSAALRTGTETNRLGLVRSGDTIMLYANGQYIGGASDGVYHGTLIGLWAERYSSDYDARFDNFAVYTKTCTEAGGTAAGRITMSVESGDH